MVVLVKMVAIKEEFNGIIGIIYMNSKPKKYLLVLNKKTNNITFPAGGRENGETSLDTLHREIQEETGLKQKDYVVSNIPFDYEFTYGPEKKERAGQKVKQLIFLIKTNKSKLVPEDPEVNVIGWFTAEEVLGKLTFNDLKQIFRRILTVIK